MLPADLLRSFKLMKRRAAYKNIHFPESQEYLDQATNRLKFEELFIIQLELLRFKWRREKALSDGLNLAEI